MLKKFRIQIDLLHYYIILALSSLIFFQQVFVINIGGSFKIYELLCFLILIIFIINPKKKIYGYGSLILFLFFVVIPIISHTINIFNLPIDSYYQRFPEASESVRFKFPFAQILILLYGFFIWASINAMSSSINIHQKLTRVIKTFVITGTISGIYGFYGMIGIARFGLPDIIPDFLDFRNSQPEDYPNRLIGFSNEPGTFVPLVAWSVIYLTEIKGLFTRKTQKILQIFNSLVLIATMSSLVLIFIGTYFGYKFIKSRISKKIILFLATVLTGLFIYKIAVKLGILSFIEYSFYIKFNEFLNPAAIGGNGSGVQRAYTSSIGWRIFQENPIFGVGTGNSYYHMHLYEFDLPFYVDMLTDSTAPQNSHIKILSENGIIGYSLFAFFFAWLLIGFSRVKNNSISLSNSFTIGIIFTLLYLISVYPIYSFFIWFNIGLGMNYLNFQNSET